MREKLTTAGEIGGIALVAVGFGVFSVGLGLIAAGVGVFLVAFVAGDGE